MGLGMYGVLWDVGFGVAWTNPNVDLWDREEDVGWMGSYGMWDLGSGGPKMDIWDWDGRIWGTGIKGVIWDLGFGVVWPNGGDMGSGMRMGMDGIP